MMSWSVGTKPLTFLCPLSVLLSLLLFIYSDSSESKQWQRRDHSVFPHLVHPPLTAPCLPGKHNWGVRSGKWIAIRLLMSLGLRRLIPLESLVQEGAWEKGGEQPRVPFPADPMGQCLINRSEEYWPVSHLGLFLIFFSFCKICSNIAELLHHLYSSAQCTLHLTKETGWLSFLIFSWVV